MSALRASRTTQTGRLSEFDDGYPVYIRNRFGGALGSTLGSVLSRFNLPSRSSYVSSRNAPVFAVDLNTGMARIRTGVTPSTPLTSMI